MKFKEFIFAVLMVIASMIVISIWPFSMELLAMWYACGIITIYVVLCYDGEKNEF